MHFGNDEGHMLTDGIGVVDVSQAARRLQRPAAGWREGVPARIPEALGGHPRRA
jgi:hypothetical protein